MQTLTVATVVIFVALCVIVDVRTRRIPNAISGAAMLLGVTLNTAYLGTAGLLDSLAGLGITVGVLLWPFAMGGIGGGDVKMMGAIGALLGPFFQAEDGIRDLIVTGVQTCALPIYHVSPPHGRRPAGQPSAHLRLREEPDAATDKPRHLERDGVDSDARRRVRTGATLPLRRRDEIGRASCRERV